MDQAVSQVTIIGGGTTGWLAALMLHTRLNYGRQAPPIKVSLIESPTVPIIGVGEGSLRGLSNEFQYLGLAEDEFFRRCNATFKLGVRFVGWNQGAGGEPYTYVHPVSSGADVINGKSPLYHYLTFGPQRGRDANNVIDSLDRIGDAIRLKRAPRHNARPFFQGAFPYAYHFDAARVAEYLREVAVGRGVVHILDDVDDAVVTDGDLISHLRLRRNGLVPVELVLDCTGFRGQIISRILKEPFLGYGDNLLCDRAVPIQIPYRPGEDIDNVTTATALSAGWVWRIPLHSRIGTGYVYSSKFISDDDAVRELCAHLGLDPEKQQPRVIQMRVGRVRRAWVGNCIAVGLAGGFVEPLEATAIMSSMVAAFLVTRHFPTRSVPEAFRKQFNWMVNNLYDQVRDFLTMHYYLATRPEPFWLAARAQSVLSETLRENLELWRHRLPERNDLPHKPGIFSDSSYGINLVAKQFYRDRRLFFQANVMRRDWEQYGSDLERQRAVVQGLPMVRQFLDRVRGEEASPAVAAPAMAERAAM